LLPELSSTKLLERIGCNVTSLTQDPFSRSPARTFRWLYSRQHSCMFRAVKPWFTAGAPSYNDDRSPSRTGPDFSKICHWNLVQCAEPKTAQKNTAEYPTSIPCSVYSAFLTLRFEDALKPPEIDDQILGSLDSSLSLSLPTTENRLAGNQHPHSFPKNAPLGSA
jgi:hypothetical protein